MSPTDTIVALASPPGRSARALIRISGPETGRIAGEMLSNASLRRGVGVARLALDNGTTLPVLYARFVGPASYTGEDACEIQLPGNPHLVERAVRAILAHAGTRLAGPGEFSARAYLNGRLSLEQAEGVAATIAARTEEQLAAARALLAGKAGQEYRRLSDECATLLALVEAGIDFTDQEDVVAIAPRDLRRRVAALREAIRGLLGSTRGTEEAESLARVVLVGRPNAGKSTLFNALLGRTRAVTSPLAGTTRDVLAEALDLGRDVPGAGEVTLIDLAGLDERASAAAIDSTAQAAARAARDAADVLVWCDPRGEFRLDELGLPTDEARPIVRVRTFADRPGVGGAADVAVCALDGFNLPVLRRSLADAAVGARAGGLAALLPRHRRALRQAGAGLRAAEAGAAQDATTLASPEVVASALREALDALGELVGRISPDDVIGRVFAMFCVGK